MFDTVTSRISKVKQPYGGYINPRKMMQAKKLDVQGPQYDYKEENVHASIVGSAVDYMTRFMTGTPVAKAFEVSLRGALNMGEDVSKYVDSIRGLDDTSIVSALRLADCDVAYRAGLPPKTPPAGIQPNKVTVENVRAMAEAGIAFFEEYGPVTKDGITFPGGYTDTVAKGDGDFMTEDTVWDFKCSVRPPTSKHTLQIAMYWLMGLHSDYKEDYRKVARLGIFNPRLVTVYTVGVDSIPKEVLHEIEVDVIGYDEEDALF